MSIKNYLQLDEREKEEVKLFVGRHYGINVDDIEKQCTTEVHGYGKGCLFMFSEGKVIARANVVLEVAEVMKTIYIHFIDILENAKQKENILKRLIDQCVELSIEYKAEKVLLGIRNDELLKVSQNIGLESKYSAFNMVLENREVVNNLLDLIPLSTENISEYVDIYNKSFMDMPHGTYIDDEEAEEHFKNELIKCFIVKGNNEKIGFLEITIEGNIGTFDIGLCKEYRGKGYGRQLLETAIDYLNREEVERVELIVIEKNNIAFEMYKKRGFKVYNNLSRWIEIN